MSKDEQTDRFLWQLQVLAHRHLDGARSADGSLEVSVPAPPRRPRATGEVMPDGTVHAGLSPDTGRRFFAAPKDAKRMMKFNQAARYVARKNEERYLGHDDWRLPTPDELKQLYDKRKTGGLKGTFRTGGEDDCYWTSARRSKDWAVERDFGGHGRTSQAHVSCRDYVRLVRG